VKLIIFYLYDWCDNNRLLHIVSIWNPNMYVQSIFWLVITFRHRASSIWDRRFAILQRTLFIYWINKYISLADIYLTVHHWYKYCRQPTRCKHNGLLIIPVSSTCFGQLFCPSSGALDCVLQFVLQCTHDVADRWPATSWGVHYTTNCNTQSSSPEDVQNNSRKHVEMTGIINKPLLLHLDGGLYYLYFIIFFWDLLNNLNLFLYRMSCIS
jgi:hypothetical protein